MTARKILDASLDELQDPDFIVGNVIIGDPGSRQGVFASYVLQIRLAAEVTRGAMELNATLERTSAAANKLQVTANSFNRSVIWLTGFMVLVAALQAYQVLWG